MHEFGDLGGVGHVHSDTNQGNFVYWLDNVKLTTIGVDVGSSTMHLMFARVHLHRETQNLSSRFEVVAREVLWKSDIALTPYWGRRIDAGAVGNFVAACHNKAGITPENVDSGAVILTGEALRRANARAIAEAIAAGSGKFVCVCAGHHLESMLAAYGSGATNYTDVTGARLLHIDIGGGTTKLSLLEDGKPRATSAFMVGGRQVAWDQRREIVSTTAGARTIAHELGLDITVGKTFSPEAERQFVEAQAGVIFAIANGDSGVLGRRLQLTRLLPKLFKADTVSFSGGVSEYIYDREPCEYGDLGPALGRALRAGIEVGRVLLPVIDPGEGIRATVIGASQASVQLSGNTVAISDQSILPIHNIPVVHPELQSWNKGHRLESEELSSAIKVAMVSYGLALEDAVALAFSWHGDPSYQQLEAFARGVQQALSEVSISPLIVLTDEDLGASIGQLLVNSFPVQRPLICLDGLDLSPFDFIDVGTVLEPSGAVPIVIKSLLFSTTT